MRDKKRFGRNGKSIIGAAEILYSSSLFVVLKWNKDQKLSFFFFQLHLKLYLVNSNLQYYYTKNKSINLSLLIYNKCNTRNRYLNFQCYNFFLFLELRNRYFENRSICVSAKTSLKTFIKMLELVP